MQFYSADIDADYLVVWVPLYYYLALFKVGILAHLRGREGGKKGTLEAVLSWSMRQGNDQRAVCT